MTRPVRLPAWRRTAAVALALPILLTCCDAGTEAGPLGDVDVRPAGEAGDDAVEPRAADDAVDGTDPTHDADRAGSDTNPGGTDPRAVESATGVGAESRRPDADGRRRCRPDLVAGSTEEPVSIQVWHTIGNDLEGVFEAMLRRFDQLRDDVVVASTRFDTYDVALREFAKVDPADAPDLLLGQVDNLGALVASDRFVPPFECADGERPDALQDLLPLIERTFAVDGRYVAAPFLVSTPVLVYDRRRWELAGLDPDRPPRTAEELEAAASAVVSSGAAPGGLVLSDRSASWFLEQWAAREGRLLVTPDNGHDPSVDPADRRVAFRSEEAIAALRWLERLHDGGLIRWIGLNETGIEDLFALVDPNAPAGMTLHTSAATGDLTRLLSAPDTPFPDAELGIGPLPGPGRGSLVGGNGWWLTDTGDPARIGAAWQLVDWLVHPDQQAALTNTSGYVPLSPRAAEHPSVVSWWRQEPNFRVGYDQLAESDDTPAAAGMRLGPRIELQRVLELAAVDVVANHVDPALALDTAVDRAEELLALFIAAGD